MTVGKRRNRGYRYLAYGAGTNSVAILVGWVKRRLVRSQPIDLILFGDTGGEKPHTYEHIEIMNRWLKRRGLPGITTVKKGGSDETLEQVCLRLGVLPAIAYGRKTCSLRFKVEPQERYLNRIPEVRELWERGELVEKLIGFDYAEERRWARAPLEDEKYRNRFPLVEWKWARAECIEAIREAGIKLPGKSACFFCPSSKKHEIAELERRYPDLYRRALAIEKRAMPKIQARLKAGEPTPLGLGRQFAWRDYAKTRAVDPPAPSCMACYDGDD